MSTKTTRYTLWGIRPDYAGGEWIKLEIGSLTRCRAEKRSRLHEPWSGLTITLFGDSPAAVKN